MGSVWGRLHYGVLSPSQALCIWLWRWWFLPLLFSVQLELFLSISYHAFPPLSSFVGLWLCGVLLPGALALRWPEGWALQWHWRSMWSVPVWWGRCALCNSSPKQAVTPVIGQVMAQRGSWQVFCGALGLGSGKALGRACSGTDSQGQQLVKNLLSNRNSHFILLEKEHFPCCFWFLFPPPPG